ncbi:MAG: MmcQ/YjbR family DNA-binding protein [Bacteroidales bacterium]|nr:MmcQ/YjbR family DNA-binding protein [Bacteroidales bacterium]
MNIEEVRTFCLTLPETTEAFPFDDVTLIFKVCGKMFLLLPLDSERHSFSVKCDPEKAIELREKYSCVEAAYHFNKKHWNTIYLTGEMQDNEIRDWIEHSYKKVVEGLPKIDKQRIFNLFQQ